MSNRKESAALRRFNSTINELRNITRGNIKIDDQKEIAHLINEIEQYGFDFFPNHYVYDKVVELEVFVRKLKIT